MNSPCMNGGTCTDQDVDYSCDCQNGWTGKYCDNDIDECSSSPCQNGGTCKNQVGDYSCDCQNGWTGKDCDNEGAAKVSCGRSGKLDLQLIMDSSGSIGPKRFRYMLKEISRSFISHFDIGPDKTRVAMFKYSNETRMRHEFPLHEFTNLDELQAQIESTKYERGRTYTAMAMRKALEIYKKDQRMDKDTAKVCIVFTDGNADDQIEVPEASKAWANDGVTVLAVGIGSKITKENLAAVSGSEERAFKIRKYRHIARLAKSLLKKVCPAPADEGKNAVSTM